MLLPALLAWQMLPQFSRALWHGHAQKEYIIPCGGSAQSTIYGRRRGTLWLPRFSTTSTPNLLPATLGSTRS
ncbi:hypothetical protein OE88DRAFT_1654588 [Heliocybe sulcata]|uniref:Secreted protein n=1 Tax=Heliocybe sulcata TaxID=5364 RepID=A0A5C3N8C8_9AGAM|nr:hypothetical protein OE88DRAFT_1654588 [Heliocybe sulcata]